MFAGEEMDVGTPLAIERGLVAAAQSAGERSRDGNRKADSNRPKVARNRVPVPTLLIVKASLRRRPSMSRLTIAAVLLIGHDGIVHVIAAAPKAPFLASEQQENHRAVQLLGAMGTAIARPPAPRPRPRRCRPRRDKWPRACEGNVLSRAVAQVVVVRSRHDRLVGQRPFAGKNGRNVLHFAGHVPQFDFALHAPARQVAS